jgi:hypothetical protein
VLIESIFVSYEEHAEARLATIHQLPSDLHNATPTMDMQLPPPVTTSQAIPNPLPANRFNDPSYAVLSNEVFQHEPLSLNPNVELLDHDMNDNDWYIMTLSGHCIINADPSILFQIGIKSGTKMSPLILHFPRRSRRHVLRLTLMSLYYHHCEHNIRLTSQSCITSPFSLNM